MKFILFLLKLLFGKKGKGTENTEEIRTKATDKPQYRDKFNLLNKSEQLIYWRLVEAVPNLVVLSQVSMSQLFFIGPKAKQRQLNEIGRKSVDFLLCRKDFSIVTAIELNGPTHATASQQKSDETKRRTLEEAGIPLITIYPQDIPAVEEIRKKIAPMMVARSQYEASRNERNGFNKRSRHGANP